MNNNKKNGFIRLLGKLGRRCKALRVPITVLVVVGVSVYHMLHKLFFDMTYHKTRMRVALGTLCVALLVTLFVIPAFADEMDLLESITEIVSSSDETPSPSPESDESVYDGLVMDTDQEVQEETDYYDGSGDESIDDGLDTDPDGEQSDIADDEDAQFTDEDGSTYTVDEDGNYVDENGDILDPSDVAMLAKTPAMKAVRAATSLDSNAKIVVEYSGNNGTYTDGSKKVTYTFGTANTGNFSFEVNQEDVETDNQVPESNIYYSWDITYSKTSDGTYASVSNSGSSSSKSFSLPSGSSLSAGYYKVKFSAKVSGDTATPKTEEWTVEVDKAKLEYNSNINTGSSLFNETFYVSPSENTSKIPFSVGANSSIFKNIIVDSSFSASITYRPRDGAGGGNTWDTPGTYVPILHVDKGQTNYDEATIELTGFELKVAYADIPARPYSISPQVGTGLEKEDGYKWYNQTVRITPSSGYMMAIEGKDEYIYSAASPLEYDDGSHEPGTLQFRKVEGDYQYVINEKYNEDGAIKFFIDTKSPEGSVSITSKPQTEGYYKDDIEFKVDLKDEGSGIPIPDEVNGYVKVFVSDGKTNKEISDLNMTTNDNGLNLSVVGKVDISDYKAAGTGKIYIYATVKDRAGNTLTTDKESYVTIDTESPKVFSTTGRDREIVPSEQGDAKVYYVAVANGNKTVTVTDNVGLADISVDSNSYFTSSSGDLVTSKDISLTAPAEGVSEPVTYKITAHDLAGNESIVFVKVALASVDIDEQDIVLGNEDVIPEGESSAVRGCIYGYSASSVEKAINLVRVDTQSLLKAKVVSAKLTGGTDFVIGGSSGAFTVKPAEKLDVGKHVDTIEMEYDIVDASDNTIIAEHTVNIPVSFTVVKAELKAQYMGTTEYFHAKADFKFKDEDNKSVDADTGAVRWASDGSDKIALRISGFVYDQGLTISSDVGAEYKDPALKVEDSSGRHNLAPGGSAEYTPNGGEAKNYYFTYEKGVMSCIRRDLSNVAVTVIRDADDTIESNPLNINDEWYTSAINILPSDTDTYEFYNVTDDESAQSEYLPHVGDNGDVEDSKYSTEAFKYYDETTGTLLYYYIRNKKTGEVSLLAEKNIKIDRTDASKLYSSNGGESEGSISNKPDGSDKETSAPYFHIEGNTWKEFLHNVTLRMYFNDTMQVTVENVWDNISGVASVDYLISPTDYVGEKGEKFDADAKASLDGGNWHSANTSWAGGTAVFSMTKDEVEEGYIYIRITNNAGLSCYLTSDRVIVFDSDGPQIYSDYYGEDYIGAGRGGHQISNGDEIVAEEVKITVFDTNLHDPTNNKSITDPAIEIYKGTDISGGAVESNSAFVSSYEGAEGVKLWTSDTPLTYGTNSSQTYTVVARDDSGFVTIRYFTIVKPKYDAKGVDISFNQATYGYDSAGTKKVTWTNTSSSNAKAEMLNVTVDKPEEFTVLLADEKSHGAGVKDPSSSDGWTITPVTGLKAGTHTATLTLTYYDLNNSTKVTTAKVSFIVRKKELTASYTGDTIKRGETPSTTGKLKVTGFIDGEGPEDSGTVKKAAGYVSPVINIPADVSDTTVIKPSGGYADNYSFTYVGGVLTVTTNKAEKNTHYNVTGTLADTGWYVSNITITPKEGFLLTSDSLGKVTMENIVITKDTDSGEQRFYIKDKETGEMYEQTIFAYKKDVIAPVISGINDGETYEANTREVTVTDDYLSTVTVNGIRQPVSGNKAVFNLVADQKEKIFFVVAQDRAGHMTTSTVTLKQLDGSDDDNNLTDDEYNPDDDMIQDDTDDADDTDLGTVTKKVQLVDGAPTTTMTDTTKQLKTSVLSSSERSAVTDGSDAEIKLRVQDISGSVSQADKEVVIATLGDYTVAEYLDITLWKTVGSGTEQQIHSANKAISVTIAIPSSLRDPATGKVREFAIIRVHNGSGTVLQDRDSSANTITISTAKFSVYALAYRDVNSSSKASSKGTSISDNSTPSSSGSGSGSGGSSRGYSVETDGIVDGSPQTGDKAPVIPTAVGFGAAFIGMVAIVIIKRRDRYMWVYLDDDGNYVDEDGNPVEI